MIFREAPTMVVQIASSKQYCEKSHQMDNRINELSGKPKPLLTPAPLRTLRANFSA